MDEKDIISTNFDYDVYSGGSAMEYLKQENERKRQERERAKKSAGELKREEYEKKFAGMSADEIFGMPEKKQPKEEDYSDFFDDDAAVRQAQKDKEIKEEPLPTIENMMPGEDDPSSQPPDEKYRAGIETAAAMMAQSRIRREKAEERRMYYHGGYGRYRRRSSLFSPLGYPLGYRSFTSSRREISSTENAIYWYFGFAMLGVLVAVVASLPIGMTLLVCTGLGALGSVIRRMSLLGMNIVEAISSSWIELAIVIPVGIFAIVTAF